MRPRIVFAAACGLALGLGVAAAFAGTPGYYVSGEGGVSLPPDLHLDRPRSARVRTASAPASSPAARSATTSAPAGESR